MDTLRESIQSVLDQTTQPDKFIVIDNASTDDSRQIAVDMGVEVVDADNRFKFITGLNTAMDLKFDLLFFMQNDVILDENCIKYMIEDRPKYSTFIAQPVIYDQEGNIDNAGMDYKWPGLGKRRHDKWWDGLRHEDCGLVTTICFMTNIGSVSFDERFYPAYYEDLDFYLRTKCFYHVLIPAAKAIHKGNHTFSQTYKKYEISEICRRNRKKLIKKHYRGLDRMLRLAVTSCADVVKKSFDVITDRWIAKNNRD